MDIKSLKIKTKTTYDLNDIFYINDFDVNSLEIIKRESKIDANIYHIGYIFNPDYNAIKPLHFLIDRLIGYIEEIEGSSDEYLIVVSSVRNKNIINAIDMVWTSIKDKINSDIKIKDYDKFRFNSDIDLPLNTIIEFHSLVINISFVIEKDNEYYPEIYLDECLFVKDNPCFRNSLVPLKNINII